MPQRKHRLTDTNSSAHDRFWQKIDKNGPTPENLPHLGNCWIWTAKAITTSNGYGRLNMGGKYGPTIHAHVFAYEEANGPIPQGMVLDHLCATPLCVRPTHLEVKTHKSNLRARVNLDSRNKVGYRGVRKAVIEGRYIAYTNADGKQHSLGTYFNVIDAANAALLGRLDYHGYDGLSEPDKLKLKTIDIPAERLRLAGAKSFEHRKGSSQ